MLMNFSKGQLYRTIRMWLIHIYFPYFFQNFHILSFFLLRNIHHRGHFIRNCSHEHLTAYAVLISIFASIISIDNMNFVLWKWRENSNDDLWIIFEHFSFELNGWMGNPSWRVFEEKKNRKSTMTLNESIQRWNENGWAHELLLNYSLLVKSWQEEKRESQRYFSIPSFQLNIRMDETMICDCWSRRNSGMRIWNSFDSNWFVAENKKQLLRK